MGIIELAKDIAMSKASEVRGKLKDEFQKELFDAAIANLLDHHNKLRINNFAYAARELIRIYLSSVVDDGEVAKCCWFQGDENGKPTRAERMHYAIHRGLISETVAKKLHYDPDVIIKNLVKNINSLSEYTHVGENTFPTNDCDNKLALNLFDNLAAFLDNIIGAKQDIINALESEVYRATEDGLLSEYFDQIDHLATHSGIEGIYIDNIHIEHFDCESLVFIVEGNIDFSLQWGSNSDVRKEDGAIGGLDVGFSATIKADIEDLSRLEISSYSLNEQDLSKMNMSCDDNF